MTQQTVGQLLDFDQYVEERVQGFTGREWVLARLDGWLGGRGARSFLITGEPGSGKTALAGRLFQISRGRAPAANGFDNLKPGFLGAAHFCSARAQSWITPHTFTESLSLQLARYPAFARALAERSGDRRVRIVVRQEVQEAEGAVTGVRIERLDLSGIAPEDGFVRTVREPLEALLAQEPDLQVCILVDALDEALLYSGPVGIASLLAQSADLPDRVRFILTSRADERVENAFRQAEVLHLSGEEFASDNRDDVRRYVAGRMRSDVRLAPRAAALGPESVETLTAAITERASGNFQYVRFLLDSAADGLRDLEDAEGLPVGLNGLYLDSLERVVRLGDGTWATSYAPLVGVLSVAQESLTLAQLRALSGLGDPEFWRARGDLRQFAEVVQPEAGGEARYRLYHQSLADFLRLPTLRVEGRELANPFFLPARGWHERIADHYLAEYSGYWSECEDGYGLRFLATHLAEASREGGRLERHARIARLVELVTDPDFQAAHQARLEDPTALHRDLERALLGATTDRHPEAVPLVVEAAMALTAVRRRHLHPAAPFDLALAGRLEEAERRLMLYGPELEWRQAILLTLGWLAAAADPAGARGLRDRVVAEGVAPPLDLLVARLDAELGAAPPPPLPLLPPPPDLYFVAGILDRLGGGNNITGIEPLDLEHLEAVQADADSAPAYLAEQDGPPLVAFAALDPARNTAFLREYIALHAANGYLHYRNRSLWALVAPVLRHPDPAWAKELLGELSRAALAETRIDFREALPLALQALRERAGHPIPGPSFPERVERASQEARVLPAPARGEGDPWGHHLRRLSALAEILALVPGDRPRATALLDQARALPFGFAGFRAPACLTLAETLGICTPDAPGAPHEALEQARRAAHNVQDYVLCARATSRVNGMAGRWWPAAAEPLDVATAARRFAAAPEEPEFAPVHRIGESYELRVDTPQRLHIPPWAREAATLAELSAVYQRSLSLFAHLNLAPGRGADTPLPAGESVNVPDPEFTPLLAARMAAAALAAPALSARDRVELILALVPRAVANPTALDLVLARLVIAARPADPGLLDRLWSSLRWAPEEPGEASGGEAHLPPPGVPA